MGCNLNWSEMMQALALRPQIIEVVFTCNEIQPVTEIRSDIILYYKQSEINN